MNLVAVMDKLPAEVLLVVEDCFVSGTTFAEWVVDTQGFAGFGKREALFVRWLKMQPRGQPLDSFVGTLEELAFVRDHIHRKQTVCTVDHHVNSKTVFVDHCVSVTCNIRESDVRWWLTRESGQLPTNSNAKVIYSGCTPLAKAYAVVRVARPLCLRKQRIAEVGVAQLCVASLDWIVEGIVPYVQPIVLERVADHVECTSAEDCPTAYHVWRQLWIQCSFSGGVGGSSEWLLRDRFNGFYPSGRQHWWTGLTNAADEALCCTQSGLLLDGGWVQ
jgi:hypothetical protein